VTLKWKEKICTPSDMTLFFILLFQSQLCQMEYIFYFILILYFKHNGMSSTKKSFVRCAVHCILCFVPHRDSACWQLAAEGLSIAILIKFNNCPTRYDLFSLLHFCRQLYMFRVLTPKTCRAAYKNVINWTSHILLDNY